MLLLNDFLGLNPLLLAFISALAAFNKSDISYDVDALVDSYAQ